MLLTIMNRKWSKLGIEACFPQVNHIKSEKIEGYSPTFSSFVNDCSHQRIKGENAQTIERALEVAHYIEKGITPNTAISIAWKSYPLLES